MNYKTLVFIGIAAVFMNCKSTEGMQSSGADRRFNLEKDLLLVQFDCKTDVDDLHTVAAFATLISNPKFAGINYHAVAGTYGIQEGLYVPANDLFQLAFRDNWTDAHEKFAAAIEKVKDKSLKTLTESGDVWIAEAGQSDFTAGLIKAIQRAVPEQDVSSRIHVVQHSDWNEKSTSTGSLQFVKETVHYQKIPDGNIVGNGTPRFNDPLYDRWSDKVSNPKLKEVWQLAVDLSNRYNGREGRYDNKAISAGGLDFSDLAEVCWILGLEQLKDTEQFFDVYAD